MRAVLKKTSLTEPNTHPSFFVTPPLSTLPTFVAQQIHHLLGLFHNYNCVTPKRAPPFLADLSYGSTLNTHKQQQWLSSSGLSQGVWVLPALSCVRLRSCAAASSSGRSRRRPWVRGLERGGSKIGPPDGSQCLPRPLEIEAKTRHWHMRGGWGRGSAGSLLLGEWEGKRAAKFFWCKGRGARECVRVCARFAALSTRRCACALKMTGHCRCRGLAVS